MPGVGSEVEAAARKRLRRNRKMLIFWCLVCGIGSGGLEHNAPLWVRMIGLAVVILSSAEYGSNSRQRADTKRFIRGLHQGVIKAEYTKGPHRCDESCSP